MFRKIQNVVVGSNRHAPIANKYLFEVLFELIRLLFKSVLKFVEALKTLKKCLGVNGFWGKKPLQASVTPHGGLLGNPGNFQQAQNHKNKDDSIFGKVKLRNT